MTPDTSGHGSLKPFAFFDPESHSLRTSLGISVRVSTPFSATLPRSGTMRSGVLYERPMLALATSGTGSSSLLRTPTAQVTEAKNGIKLEGRTPSDPQVGLADQVVALFPTPKAQEAGWNVANTTTVDGAKAEPGQRAYDAKGVHKTWGMQQVVDSLLPTPVVNDMGSGKTVDQWEELRLKWKAKHANGNGHGNSLSIEVAKLLPTPMARDHKNAAATEQTALDRIDRGYGLDIAEAIQLLPTPRAMSGGGDNTAGKDRPSGHKGTTNLHGLL